MGCATLIALNWTRGGWGGRLCRSGCSWALPSSTAGFRSSAIPASCIPARRPTSAPSCAALPTPPPEGSCCARSRSRTRRCRGWGWRWWRLRLDCWSARDCSHVRPPPSGWSLNLLLFLTNSWHTYPYFLGSDIVFVFAWLPFVVVGAARQPTLEAALRRVTASRATPSVRPPARSAARSVGARPAGGGGDELTRRSVMGASLGAVAAATAAIAGLSVLLRGSYRPPRSLTASRARSGGGEQHNQCRRRGEHLHQRRSAPIARHQTTTRPMPSSSARPARSRLARARPTRIRVMASPTSSSDRPMELWSPIARCAPTPDAPSSTGEDRSSVPATGPPSIRRPAP